MSGRPRTTSFAESCKPVQQPSAFGSMKVSREYCSPSPPLPLPAAVEGRISPSFAPGRRLKAAGLWRPGLLAVGRHLPPQSPPCGFFHRGPTKKCLLKTSLFTFWPKGNLDHLGLRLRPCSPSIDRLLQMDGRAFLQDAGCKTVRGSL